MQFPAPTWQSEPSVTPVPGNLIPSSGCTDTGHAHNTHAYKKTIKIKEYVTNYVLRCQMTYKFLPMIVGEKLLKDI